MKKFRYLVATLMIAAIVAVVLAGCKKEKSNETQSNNGDATEEVVRKPIAVFEKNTGTMKTMVDLEILNSKLNDVYATRGGANRYIIESFEISDSLPFDNGVMAIMKMVVIDTETEYSNSLWFANGFIEKCIEDDVYYYSNDGIISGEFKCLSKNEEGTKLNTLLNGTIINSIPVNDSLLSYSNGPQYPWELSCRSQNCGEGCQVSLDRPTYSYVCSPCRPDPECGLPPVCIEDPHPLRSLEILITIVGVFLWFL